MRLIRFLADIFWLCQQSVHYQTRLHFIIRTACALCLFET